MVDIKYSQNFYTNLKKLETILKSLNFTPKDIVIDIGAGKGILTKELYKYSKNIIAYEKDNKLFEILKKNLVGYSEISLKNKDFLDSKLPDEEFKIFANIPFSLTTDTINKITDSNSNLSEAYLFVQKEAALRYIGQPKNTQIAEILSFKYQFNIIEYFNKNDFTPIPNVEIVLLRIKKKRIEEAEFSLYRDFITYIFNQRNHSVFTTLKKLFTQKQLKYLREYFNKNGYLKPSDIPSDYYHTIFNYFKKNGEKYISRVSCYYKKHILQHINQEKVHRTR
jgi:23S rRNA (adenine-N6)-dimethyltransferase